MSQASTSTKLIVRDAKSGRLLTVKGAGALKGSTFSIQKDVDLTKPIASQAMQSPTIRKSKT
jgi:hypothetical protein